MDPWTENELLKKKGNLAKKLLRKEIKSDFIKNKLFYSSLLLGIIISFSAASYFVFYNLYSKEPFGLKVLEVFLITVFVSPPWITVFLRHRKKIIKSGYVANILMAAIGVYTFYSMLVMKYDVSTSSFAFILVPLYQYLIVVFFYLFTYRCEDRIS